jgi:hypothetical protein
MGLLDLILRRPQPADVLKMPNNPSEFISQLCRRKFWRDMDASLLGDIARHADGQMELLRTFVFVSEQYRLVSNNFVRIAQDPVGDSGSILSWFALTLGRLGSALCQQSPSISDFEQRGFALLSADMAFTSAILCDAFQLQAYAGMALLYGYFNLNKPVALDWCQKYKDAEDRLLATPDEKLTTCQKSTKRLVQDPAEMRRVMEEIANYAPHVVEGYGALGEIRSQRDEIEELEAQLLREHARKCEAKR